MIIPAVPAGGSPVVQKPGIPSTESVPPRAVNPLNRQVVGGRVVVGPGIKIKKTIYEITIFTPQKTMLK